MKAKLRPPSPALVVACIALGIVLGGTGYAATLQVPRNSVGTPQLKNSAVNSLKVRNRSLLRVDFAAGQIPAGPTGPAGPAGPAGPSGPAGPAGLSALERVQTTTASNSSTAKTQSMVCPTGKRLLGGGAKVDPAIAGVAIQSSYPGDDNTYWAVAREIVATASNWTLTVYAVCANAS